MTREEMNTAVRTALIVAAVGILFALGVKLLQGKLCGTGWCQWWPSLSKEGIVQIIRDSGPWGVLVSMGLMVLHSFVPFPSELLTMANGMIYGPLWGTVVSWAGAMLGALLAYFLALKLGSGFVRRMLGPERCEGIDRWLSYNGPGALFVVRLIPAVSFNLINYASGLARVPLWTFIWTTAIGMLPVTIIVVYMGANVDQISWWQWAALLTGGLAVWGLMRLYRKRYLPGS
jgi:uncharacterized membrane protein YdjX (TVP38/TMEM64 family)